MDVQLLAQLTTARPPSHVRACFSDDGTLLACPGREDVKEISLWRINAEEKLFMGRFDHASSCTATVLTREPGCFYFPLSLSHLLSKLPCRLIGHTSPVVCMCFVELGKESVLVSASSRETLLWNMGTMHQ